MNILLCDHDASSRVVARRMLMAVHGCAVTECTNGADALDALGSGGFDVLMLEVKMPVLDGFDTLAIIRASSEMRHLPVIVLTSEGTESAVRRALALGVEDYLVKPLRMDRLWPQLSRLITTVRAREMRSGRLTASASSIESATRLMVVDGDTDFREFFTTSVSPYCTVLEAATGAAALATAAVTAPSVLFVGRDIGLVGPANLIKHITKLGVRSVVKLATPEETDADIASKLYDDVIGRTLIASELLSDLKRVIKLPGEAPSAVVRTDPEPAFAPDDTDSQRLRHDAFRDQRRQSGDQVQEVHTRS